MEPMKPLTVAEIEDIIERDYVLTITNDGEWYKRADPHNLRTTYADLRSASWGAIDRITVERNRLVDYRAIPYVKRRVTVALWFHYHPNPALSALLKEDMAWIDSSNNHLREPLKRTPVTVNIVIGNPGKDAESLPTTFDNQLEKIDMSKAFETTVTNTVYGQDIEKMDESQLITAIKKVDGEIASLEAVKGSAKIVKMVEDLRVQRQAIVNALDAK